jgi:hypothetical protein
MYVLGAVPIATEAEDTTLLYHAQLVVHQPKG